MPSLGVRGALLLTAAAAALAACSVSRVQTRPELTLLMNVNPELMAEQREVSRIAQPMSPGQFILLQAADSHQLQSRCEQLTERLAALRDSGEIGSFQTVTE